MINFNLFTLTQIKSKFITYIIEHSTHDTANLYIMIRPHDTANLYILIRPHDTANLYILIRPDDTAKFEL